MLCLTHVGGSAHVARPPIVSTVDPSEKLDQPAIVASLIDHTLLKPEASKADVAKLCEEARTHRFASVCVNPCWVAYAAGDLRGTDVKVCAVIGFPLGANEARVKLSEAELALASGAGELDMVQNIGALRSGDDSLVLHEIAAIAELARSGRALLKVILETCLLSEREKEKACRLAFDANADFVKTSTGFSSGGATLEDVAFMREIAGPARGVKASGGIRSLASLRSMVTAGANRIGTSSGVAIMEEVRREMIPPNVLPVSPKGAITRSSPARTAEAETY